jgi:hypothetical protein
MPEQSADRSLGPCTVGRVGVTCTVWPLDEAGLGA